MVWEFPAVSQSRVEFWKEPQFTQSGIWWFTLFFGFFGLHHMYLRSPQTALIFFIANLLTFGYPWLYDLVQLSSEGSTLESLNKHGLAHPFGALGLAQGMWKEPEGFLNSFKKMTGLAGSSVPSNLSKNASKSNNSNYNPNNSNPNNPNNSNPNNTANNPANNPNNLNPNPNSNMTNSTNTPTPPNTPANNSNPDPNSNMTNSTNTPAPNTPAPTPLAPTPPAPPPNTNPVPHLSRKEEYDALMHIPGPKEKIAEKRLGIQRGGGEGPPNPIWFLLYSLLIPIAPLAQIIAGDVNNSVSRFLDLTIVPLGFLFYLCAFIYDYFILFFYPADLLVAGSKRFFPFTYLGMDLEGHSERLTGVSEIKPCPADGFILTMLRISLPFMSFFFPGLGKSVEAALQTAQNTKEVVIDQGLAKAQEVSQVAYKVGSLSASAATAIPSAVAQASAKLSPEALMRNQLVQKGGGFTALDYTALGSLGAVIAGGFLLSLNRRQNDSPPEPRGV